MVLFIINRLIIIIIIELENFESVFFGVRILKRINNISVYNVIKLECIFLFIKKIVDSMRMIIVIVIK